MSLTASGRRSAYFIHSDELGNVIAVSDSSGNIVKQTCYGPYGDVWSQTGSFDTPWGFGGAYGVYTDPDVELLRMQARYYSPEMKRFISADPTGLKGGVNFYTYADGNPLNSIDPEGLCARPSLFGRTSLFGSGGTSSFGGFGPVGSSYSSFGRTSYGSPFGLGSPQTRYAQSSRSYQMFDDARNKWDSGHRWSAVGSAARETFGRISGFDQVNAAGSGYDTYAGNRLSAGQRLSAGVSGGLSVGLWAAGSVGTIGRGASATAGTISRSEVAAESSGLNWVTEIPKGSRPPVTYMSLAERKSHAALFQGGAVRIGPSKPVGTIGRTETWVFPRSVVDNLTKQAGGDVAKLERLIGLDAGYLGKSPVLVDIPSPKGVRIPSGNERGANAFWRAGGRTSGGLPEAIIDPVPEGSYTTRPVFWK
ncbi:MAG: RHS repeat-associated core domain-containing protein [Kiritimatiellaceae bacterium]|nr:RHS repeat-associated core domain-containing protein [Kiritimatiellaceae bacterium]